MNTYRTPNRVSLPALAMAALVALVVTGGTATLFSLQPDAAGVDNRALVTAKAAAEALPMREIVPHRVDVIGVREAEQVSVVAPALPRGERS